MVNGSKPTGTSPVWTGRLAVILIVLFVGSALVALFFAARGPR